MTTINAGSVVFEHVAKRFAGFTAVPDLSLTVEPGTLVTLLGPSGCGKTTTLRLLAGLEHPTAGRILIGGKDVTHLPANERDVAMVFQSYALFPHMNAIDNILYGLLSSGMNKREAQDRAREGLKLVGLESQGQRLPSELSGGQQQRIAVARALVLEPQVLLLDEPLSNLDERLRRRVRTDIRDLQQRLGFTAVYVTHDQEEALAVSDKIIVMKEGDIAQQGAPETLYHSPNSVFIADFMGEANILPCEVEEADADDALVRLVISASGCEVPVQKPAVLSWRCDRSLLRCPATVRGRCRGRSFTAPGWVTISNMKSPPNWARCSLSIRRWNSVCRSPPQLASTLSRRALP